MSHTYGDQCFAAAVLPDHGSEFFAGRTATMRLSRTIQTAFKDLAYIFGLWDHGAL